MSSSSQLSQEIVGPAGIHTGEDYRSDDVTEAQFDQQAKKFVQIIETTAKFLSGTGCDVQNLLVSHLEKLTTILDIMQKRNHSRSETVVSALGVLLDLVQDWTLGSSVLEFIQERDMDYFLKHANALRMTLGTEHYRLPDVLLLILLDYQCVNSKHFSAVLRYGVSVVLCPNAEVQTSLHFGKMLKAKQDEGADLSEVYQIGRLLVAALPSVFRRAVQVADVSRMLDDFPELVGRTVPSLKHLCRTIIRSKLHANWSLPDGIQLLDVPVQVKAYLDLQT